MFARGPDNILDIRKKLFANGNLSYLLPQPQDPLLIENRGKPVKFLRGHRPVLVTAVKLLLVPVFRVRNLYFQQKPVQLRFGKRVRPFVLQGFWVAKTVKTSERG